MIHLRIEQNDSAIEQVDSAIITKLYELFNSNNLDLTSNLVGRLHTPATYLEYIDALCKTLQNPNGLFPNFIITASKYYLYLGDPTLTKILANRYGDGTGCTLSDITFVNDYVQTAWSGFSGNTNIIDATGLKYFTNISWSGSNAGLYNGFKGCTNLQRCELPLGMTNLTAGNGYNNIGFFKECTNLTHVTLPSTLTYILAESFSGCTSLLLIQIPDGVTYIGDSAFSRTNIQSITLPSHLTTTGENVFGSTNLTSIHFPSSVTDIGRYCINKSKYITSVTFDQSNGNNLTLHSGGGYLAGFLTTNNMGDGEIPGITKLDFPERLTTINTGDYFFAGLPNLTTIIFRSIIPPTFTSSNVTLYINNNATIYVPDNSVSSYKSATVFSNYSNYIKGISELPSS